MSKITGNEPAIVFKTRESPYWETHKGLTIRQEFSGRFMQGLLSNSAFAGRALDCEETSKFAINCADALIAELNKQP